MMTSHVTLFHVCVDSSFTGQQFESTFWIWPNIKLVPFLSTRELAWYFSYNYPFSSYPSSGTLSITTLVSLCNYYVNCQLLSYASGHLKKMYNLIVGLIAQRGNILYKYSIFWVNNIHFSLCWWMHVAKYGRFHIYVRLLVTCVKLKSYPKYI